MAITRGQMQRQLRRGGGIMDVTPREQFGLGSSFKKFVRKVIPNEVSKVATIAAPFVAPFNPALAGAMAGIGSFDQTGSLSGALKRGALTYGGGQAARFIGGAGFQGNPFNEPLISSPLGTETGIGKLLDNRRQQLIGKQIAEQGQLNREVANIGQIADAGGFDPGTIVDPSVVSEAVATTAKQTTPSITKLIKEGNYTEAAVEAGKKGLKSIFTTPITDAQGNITGSKLDKTALLAAGSFGLTYLDAKKIADEAGVDIGTESEYDEATKEEKKKEYAGYLQNFFGGKKDGGRIGFDNGSIVLSEDEVAEIGGLPRLRLKLLAEKFIKEGMSESSAYEKAVEQLYADGGRVSFAFGDRVEDKEGIMSMFKLINRPDDDKEKLEELEDIMSMSEDENTKMAYFPGDVFTKDEIRRLFSDRSLTTNQDRKELYKILMNPGMFPEAEKMLIKMLRGNKEGGRIGFQSGTRDLKDYKFMELFDEESYNKKLKEKEDLINELMDKGYRFDDIMQLVSPKTERLMDDGTYKQYGDAPSISLGKIGFNMGGEVPVRKNKAGIEELDYRQTGGFVPVGVKEKADDVPAMLSKNEFVLTADTVRGIGGGDVEKGAEKLYGVMKQAEKVGRA